MLHKISVAFVLAMLSSLGSSLVLADQPDDALDVNVDTQADTQKPPAFWQPAVGSKWQIILRTKINVTAPLTPNVPIFDIDGESHTKEEIQTLKKKGKKVICYFSAGTFEPNRLDSAALQNYTGGSLAPEWPEEFWLNSTEPEVRKVMATRIGRLAAKGCNAIDPDNMDAYGNANGLNLTDTDALDYIKFLSTEAKKYGMSTGLKNAGAIISRAIAAKSVHFSINEQCDQIDECGPYDEFIKHRLPVFNIEYVDAVNKTHPTRCPKNPKFSTVIKKMVLDGWVQDCAGRNATTKTLSD